MSLSLNQEKATYFVQLMQELTGIRNLDKEKLKLLLEQMEIMGNLLEDFAHTENEMDLIGIGERIRLCQKESEAAAVSFLNHYGVSLESARAFLTRPDHINMKEFEIIQGIEEKFKRIEGKSLPELKARKKKKGRKI